MAKKTKAELVEEGKALKADVATARKKPLNFALYMGKEELAFHCDIKKPINVLRKAAQQEAGGKRGTIGTFTADGREVTLTCAEGEDPPAKLAKLFKKHCANRGVSVKVIMVTHDGSRFDSDAEDEASASAETADAETPAQNDVLKDKLLKAWKKIEGAWKAAVASAPDDHATLLKTGAKTFLAQMKAEAYEKALAALTTLRKDIARTPSTDRLTTALADKDDPKKLAAMAPLLLSSLERGGDDEGFKADAKPLLRDMRTALKAAQAAGGMDPETLKMVTAMKKKLDNAFLDDLAEEGHGPQRHEGKVTKAQLSDRAVSGFDPMTNSTTDGVHGGKHKYGRHATRFKDPGDYVDADETVRAHAEFTTQESAAVAAGEGRFEVRLTLEEVLGSGYAAMLEGVSRKGSAKNPTGSEDTDFTDGDLVARYKIHGDGSVTLITLFPNPQ